MEKYLLIYLIIINIFAFVIYAVDKIKAKHHKWRISEKALLVSSLVGGFVGGIFAMKVFRHKTKHWYFWCINFIALIIWCCLIWKILC